MPIDIAELRRLEAEAIRGRVRSYDLSSGDVIVETENYVPLKVARFHQGAIVDAKREAALYVAMRNALPELLKALEWQSIETAPIDGTEFLAALSNGWVVKLHATTSIREGHRFAWWHSERLSIPYVPSHDEGTLEDQLIATHWMPLPRPPHGGGDVE